MCDELLYLQLRRIAEEEGRSVAEVIRQGLEWRVAQRAPRWSFVGIGERLPGVEDDGGDLPFRAPEPSVEEIERFRRLADARARSRSA